MKTALKALLLCWIGPLLATSLTVPVGQFSNGELQDWKTKSFAGETRYQLVQQDGRRVLQADSNGTASGLYREITIDLERTPYLNWSWRVNNVLNGVDERTKAGDDYPARVYVIVSGGIAFWKTRSLVYVWSSNQPIGSTWDNAFTSNVKTIALRSGNGKGWVSEKRNIREDFKRLFGDDIKQIDAVALMTDTDNSHQAATAWYGDIYFSAE
jgi:hypothetical protein